MFSLTFWGVRGSIPCPSPGHMRYGGNTSCVSVRCGEEHLVLDAGTGIRGFGNWLNAHSVGRASLLLSHTHLDHINGFPFFEPLYRPGFDIQIYAGNLIRQGFRIKEVLAQQMSSPTFPIPLDNLPAGLQFRDFHAGESFKVGNEVHIQTLALPHPDNATAYRIHFRGQSMCYVTDTEHVTGFPNQELIAFIKGTDLLVYDCTYTDEEFESHIGWGHSTWQEGIRLCEAAQVKRLAIFHHDPDHNDEFMDRLADTARASWGGAFIAREGMTVILNY